MNLIFNTYEELSEKASQKSGMKVIYLGSVQNIV